MLTVLALAGGCDPGPEAEASAIDEAADEAPGPEASAVPEATVGGLAAAERTFGYVLDPDGEPVRITFEVHGGIAVMGGDAQLGPVDAIAATPAEALADAGARTMYGASARWPDGIMPFAIKPGLDPLIAQAARTAADHYNGFTAETGVRLEEVDADYEGDHVLVVDAWDPAEDDAAGCIFGTPCSESIGYAGGRQRVWLKVTSTPWYHDSIWQVAVHEFGHALGQYHEHSRPERVNFLTGQIPEWHDYARFGPYNTMSIMHYNKDEFAGFGVVVNFLPDVSVPPAKSAHPGLVGTDRASLAHMYGPRVPETFWAVSFMDGRCVDVYDTEAGGIPSAVSCSVESSPQQLRYDATTRELKDRHDRCFDSGLVEWGWPDMVVTRDCDGSLGQRWLVDTFGQIRADGYVFGPKPQYKCLTIFDHVREDGAVLGMTPCDRGDNQAWRTSPTGHGGATFNLESDLGKCADSPGADTGTQLWLWSCDSMNDNQRISRSDTGELKIHGKCIDAHDAEPGDPVRLWDCHGGLNQRWDRDAQGRLVSHANPKVCLEIEGHKPEDKRQLMMSLCADVAAQKWTYVLPANP